MPSGGGAPKGFSLSKSCKAQKRPVARLRAEALRWAWARGLWAAGWRPALSLPKKSAREPETAGLQAGAQSEFVDQQLDMDGIDQGS